MRIAVVLVAFFVARDAPARVLGHPRSVVETSLIAAAPPPRVASWAEALAPVEIGSERTRDSARVRLYASDGEIDPAARSDFERVAAADDEPHPLAVRLEQLVFKAAYHFKDARVLVVSGWRANAGRHGSGEALDFKLGGVRAALVAAYLRGLPRVGVGVYTNPGTQYVHLDVRVPSYYWIDASPPGAKWRERQLGDLRAGARRDASWTPDSDLPE
jgi:uncharacterized protein YcbK (DUF882 family)